MQGDRLNRLQATIGNTGSGEPLGRDVDIGARRQEALDALGNGDSANVGDMSSASPGKALVSPEAFEKSWQRMSSASKIQRRSNQQKESPVSPVSWGRKRVQTSPSTLRGGLELKPAIRIKVNSVETGGNTDDGGNAMHPERRKPVPKDHKSRIVEAQRRIRSFGRRVESKAPTAA